MKPFVDPPVISPQSFLNTLDSPVLARAANDGIVALPAWVEDIKARLRVLDPKPGSRFEDDDAMKPINPPSEQVIALLRSAHDHLHAIADAVGGVGPRPLAAFTLIRSAVEGSALAAWLMVPGTKDVRLAHSIRLSVENRKDTETYTGRFLPKNDTRVGDWFRAEMTATKDSRPGTKNMDLEANFPTLTSIIQDIDKKQKFSGLHGIDVWRACSGMAHSNAQFGGAALNQYGSGSNSGVTVRLISLWMMLQPAKQYFEYSLGLAEQHCAPTSGKGPAGKR